MLAAAMWLTAGCGYVGGPLTPLANVPMPVSDLAAIERGAVLIVHCTVPTRTTENVLIKAPVKLDLRIGERGSNFNPEEWASRAKPVSEAKLEDGLATYRIPVAEWVGKEVVLGVRAVGSNGKQAGWSNYQTLPVVAPPEKPVPAQPEDTAMGIRITWTGRGDHFRILRRGGSEEGTPPILATVEGHEWTDPGAEDGKPYIYLVQALVDLAGQKIAESDLAETGVITPKDVFPPAVPGGLHAAAGPNSIQLVWDRDIEADLAGYRVYRSVGDGPLEKLAEPGAIPSYSDTPVEKGKTYRYAVSAFDKAGNESGRCAAVEAVPQ
jgi:hypothetical protein